MTVYEPHYLLQFGGTLGDAAPEQWSCGIRMMSDAWSGFDEEGWFSGVGQSAPSAWMARADSKISNKAKLTFVKFNKIDASGHYEDTGSTREHFYPTPIAGASGAAVLPYQCTVVLSWRTLGATRGRASKGRIYSPLPGVTVGLSTGLFLAAEAQLMANSAALFLNTLDASFGVGNYIRPAIMSGVDGSWNQIDSVVVDNRVDTQRRRATNLVPVESTAVVTY